MKSRLFPMLGALAALICAPLPAAADEDIGKHLMIELNTAESQENGCKLSFLAINGHPDDIGAAVFEAVIFDASGQVDRLTLLNFSELPSARPRVRQFVIAGLECGAISRIIFNGASTCDAADLGPKACMSGLALDTKVDIEVSG